LKTLHTCHVSVIAIEYNFLYSSNKIVLRNDKSEKHSSY